MAVRIQERIVEVQQNSSSEELKNESSLIVSLVRRWGGSTADALFDPACKFFSLPHLEGMIGYRNEANCAIVFGDPICAPNHIPLLSQEFHRYCQEQRKKIIYINASEKFAQWSLQHTCKALIEFGEELVIDPYSSPMEKQGANARLVRRKVRHAQGEGAKVKEYVPYNEKLEKEIEQVGISWLKSRRGPQIHISHVQLFDNRPGKRWFYAQQGNRIVGTLLLNQLQARQGWLINHLMMTPDAPHGTAEFLVVSALAILKQEGCHFASFGTAPGAQLNNITGFGQFSTWILSHAYQLVNKIFHLNGHKTFWGKFTPESEPSYLLFSHPNISLREIIAVMRVLNAF
jgi:lysylphosphatidylglycerol synthetase-like protein (DUF2156 family)